MQFQRIPDDENRSYTSVNSTVAANREGPIQVPLHVLTGTDVGDPPAIARAARSWLEVGASGAGAYAGIVLFYDTGNMTLHFVPTFGDKFLTALIHEFAHNLGLKDLYYSDFPKSPNCWNTSALMATNAHVEHHTEYLQTLPRPSGLLLSNRTGHVRAVLDRENVSIVEEISEVYLDTEKNDLALLEYSIVRPWSQLRPPAMVLNIALHRWHLDEYRHFWTAEELAYLGIEGTAVASCPEEFESP